MEMVVTEQGAQQEGRHSLGVGAGTDDTGGAMASGATGDLATD